MHSTNHSSFQTQMPPRRTRLMCTLGPANRTYEDVAELIDAGMDVARLHFSYGSYEEHRQAIAHVRQAARDAGRHVAVLQDLCGTKIRMKAFADESVELREHSEFILTARDVNGDASEVSLNVPELVKVVEAGDTVLLNDGALRLRVQAVTDQDIQCEVTVGGRVKSQQAVHVPGKSPAVRVPTDKDKEDVLFGLEQGVDWIAQSYARTAGEIHDLRDFIRRQSADTPVMAKIERRESLQDLDAIIQAAEGIMVARGDLGLEMPIERIGLTQKDIIRRANKAGKPVVTATEMLVSMMTNPRPTRAEVTDITNAVLDGTDAVMLSGETSVGRYPAEAARVMARVVAVTDAADQGAPDEAPVDAALALDAALAREACHVARSIGAAVIVCLTRSGRTARLVSQSRPRLPIVALSHSQPVLRRCAMLKGVLPLLLPETNNQDAMDSIILRAKEAVAEAGLAASEDRVVFVAGVPDGRRRLTNLIQVETI